MIKLSRICKRRLMKEINVRHIGRRPMLKAMRKYLKKTTPKQLMKQLAGIETMNFEGPTVWEYFNVLNKSF